MEDAIYHTPAGTKAGTKHYRAWVGPPQRYDKIAAMQFGTLTSLGLRETHHVLDLGCGSLRGGRLLITYLLPDRYCGIEPEAWLIEAGFEYELGHDIKDIKRPLFDHNRDFDLGVFDRKFDFIIAQSVFSHAALWQIEQCLASAYTVMHDKSIFIATYRKGEKDHTKLEWRYPGCTFYREETMVRVAHEAGLSCETIQPNVLWSSPWLLYRKEIVDTEVSE